MMVMLLLAALSITPAECGRNVPWCYCRQYVAREHNLCLERADRLIDARDTEILAHAYRDCEREREAGERACRDDDANNMYERYGRAGEDI